MSRIRVGVGAVVGLAVVAAQPCRDNSTKRPPDPNHPSRSIGEVGPGDLHAGRQPTYVENALELLDQPGEWYLDRAALRVYYLPRPGEDPRSADVEAPALHWLRPGGGEGLSEVQATVSLAAGEHITGNVIHDQAGPGSGDPPSSAKAVTLAHNRLITGPSDAPSSIVDSAGLEPAYRNLTSASFAAPAAPTPSDRVSATAGDGFAYVAWTPSTTGSVSSCSVMSSGGQKATASAPHLRATGYVKVTGLTNRTAYTFTVAAVTAAGTGPIATSGPVTPGPV